MIRRALLNASVRVLKKVGKGGAILIRGTGETCVGRERLATKGGFGGGAAKRKYESCTERGGKGIDSRGEGKNYDP